MNGNRSKAQSKNETECLGDLCQIDAGDGDHCQRCIRADMTGVGMLFTIFTIVVVNFGVLPCQA